MELYSIRLVLFKTWRGSQIDHFHKKLLSKNPALLGLSNFDFCEDCFRKAKLLLGLSMLI